MAAGLAFVVIHATEWAGLIGEGVRLFNNPWGAPLFGAAFFTLTGLHMTHVFCGVSYLGIVAVLRQRKTQLGGCGSERTVLALCDLVWMFIFPLVYILSVKMG